MARKVHVSLGSRSYDINIGHKIPVGKTIRRGAGLKAMIVSDSNVDPLFGERCARSLRERGVEAVRVTVPAGESSKCRDQLFSLYNKAAALQLDRSSYIVALGGGVVGDLAGFVAATYLRGIRLIQVPTSLLAMVDSSIGGKTGINLESGKNLVGAFCQPVEVAADLSTLATLPRREFVSGLAEIVKYGVIRDLALFELLERSTRKIVARDRTLLSNVVARCCAIKAAVVAADEREESGARAVLNFGHTFGHALEQTAGYGRLLHGEAVSVGMVFAAELSVRQKGLTLVARDRIVRLLDRFGLPTVPPGRPMWRSLRKAMASDKKTSAGRPRFVLVGRLGSAIINCTVSESVLEETFAEVSCRA